MQINGRPPLWRHELRLMRGVIFVQRRLGRFADIARVLRPVQSDVIERDGLSLIAVNRIQHAVRRRAALAERDGEFRPRQRTAGHVLILIDAETGLGDGVAVGFGVELAGLVLKAAVGQDNLLHRLVWGGEV